MCKYIINSPDKIIADNHVFEIKDTDYKNQLLQKITALDSKWGHKIEEYDFLNNYNNDDYLIVADLLQSFRELHHNIYYHPLEKVWLKGNSEIPYIHLKFVQIPVWKKDREGNTVILDSGLNMGVTPPEPNGTHQLSFNYYWLKQYMDFLQTIFDKNEELYTSYPKYIPKRTVELVDKSELYEMARQLEKTGLKESAKTLRIYAEGAYDGRKIQKPDMVYIEIGGKHECVTWGFYDEKRHGFSIPAKKGIFNTSGFAPLFFDRNSFISELFISTVKFILGHETAHVARGHSLLIKNEPDFGNKRDVRMNCEINADWTSAHWMLDELLFETISGDINDPILAYSADRLTYLWAVRIFGCYMALSWVNRDNREWTEDIINNFRLDMKAEHPVYNLRLYNMLGKVKNHINNDYIAGERVRPGNPKIMSADRIPISEIGNKAWDKAMDMILSFESAFRVSWDGDEREILKKIKDGMLIETQSVPEDNNKIPFLLAYTKAAQEEFAQYESLWPKIREKLISYGAAYIN